MFVFSVDIVSSVCFKLCMSLFAHEVGMRVSNVSVWTAPRKPGAAGVRLSARSALLRLPLCSTLGCCTALMARASAETHNHELNDRFTKIGAKLGAGVTSPRAESAAPQIAISAWAKLNNDGRWLPLEDHAGDDQIADIDTDGVVRFKSIKRRFQYDRFGLTECKK